ncbi:MAG: endonuclease/exonuclease/phosphatase family protein [Planctomycetota bacterium]|nr:endonuclease/exonuclease/phosphatase family protein [Planctomycetota bacterium]
MRKRWLWGGIVSLGILATLLAMVIPWMLSAPLHQVLQVSKAAEAGDCNPNTLTIASLNLAHGRSTGMHQMTQARGTIQKHLDQAGALLRAHQVDLVALQEVDHKAWWSHHIDQATHVAQAAQLPNVVGGAQVDAFGLRYGTAIAAKGQLSDAEAFAFSAGPFAPGKGFTVARWDAGHGRTATVVSLHFHFLSGARQRAQAEQLVATLEQLPRPLIVCGDFNASWAPLVERIASALDLNTWQIEDRTATLRYGGRIDWILVSKNLHIVAQETLIDAPSDHAAIVATIAWNNDEQP